MRVEAGRYNGVAIPRMRLFDIFRSKPARRARHIDQAPTDAPPISDIDRLRRDMRAWESIYPEVVSDVLRVQALPGGRDALDRGFNLGWNRAQALASGSSVPLEHRNRLAIIDHVDGRLKRLRLPDMISAYDGKPIQTVQIMLSKNGPRDVKDYVEGCEELEAKIAANREHVVVYATPENRWLAEDPVQIHLPVRGLISSVHRAHVIGARLYEHSSR